MNLKPHYYEIRLEEQLDDRWAAWFSDMEFILQEPLTGSGTILRGILPDQASLFGLLGRIRDLNLTLIEVRRLKNIS